MLRHWKWLMICCVLCALLPCAAMADETIQARIPAIASGADCMAALYDSSGHRIQLLKLEKDVGNAFAVDCNGLLQTHYTAMVYSADSEDVTFDKTVYSIVVNVYYGADQQLQTSVVIEKCASADGTPGGKMGMIRFENQPSQPPATATPQPTATPEPYTERFSFRKMWSGDHEDSIDWVMYNADGSVRSKKFNKRVVSANEWTYVAYFQDNVDDCYIIEYVPDGYTAQYKNVGEYAHITDRCYNGGTIINRKVPQTGDTLPIGLHIVCMIAAGAGLVALGVSRRKRYAE